MKGALTNVRSRTTILQVSKALSSNMARNTDGCTTVGNTRGEGADIGSLVLSSQPQLVIFTINGDVFHMLLREFLDGCLDGLHSSGLTHGFGGEVGVAAGTVPVALERLGVERNFDTPFFGHTGEQKAGHPEMIAHGDTLARADLELPLRWHDLCVNSGNVDASI